MAVIDVSTIEGFETMTAEQKVDALTKYEIPDKVDMSKYVSKETFDKKASETAALSKQIRELMTEEQKKKADEDEAIKSMKEELETLRKDSKINAFKANYLKLGYEDALAQDTAEAMFNGDMEKVFQNGEKHKTELEKKIREELINSTPKPGGKIGGDDSGKDSAVEKAKEIAKAKLGGGKQYDDIMKNYRK